MSALPVQRTFPGCSPSGSGFLPHGFELIGGREPHGGVDEARFELANGYRSDRWNPAATFDWIELPYQRRSHVDPGVFGRESNPVSNRCMPLDWNAIQGEKTGIKWRGSRTPCGEFIPLGNRCLWLVSGL